MILWILSSLFFLYFKTALLVENCPFLNLLFKIYYTYIAKIYCVYIKYTHKHTKQYIQRRINAWTFDACLLTYPTWVISNYTNHKPEFWDNQYTAEFQPIGVSQELEPTWGVGERFIALVPKYFYIYINISLCLFINVILLIFSPFDLTIKVI